MNSDQNQTGLAGNRMKVFASASGEYHKAYSTFLACTDHKEKAQRGTDLLPA
jgi:hypothetical protein